MWYFLRSYIGRCLIHLGLAVLPPGKARDELNALLTNWAQNVYREVGGNGSKYTH